MAIFHTVIRKDSVSLLRFCFLSHIQVFLCEILLVSHLKYLYICFSSHLCFLVIVVLLIIVFLFCFRSLSLVFLCSYSCNLWVIILMNWCYQQCGWFHFPFLFSTHIFWVVKPYAATLVFLFSRPFIEVLPLSTSKIVLSILQGAQFSLPNSIPISWLYILIVCMRVSNSFSFLANSLMLSMYIRWLSFSCTFSTCFPSVFQGCVTLSIVFYLLCGTILYVFLLFIHAITTFFILFCSPWEWLDQCVVGHWFLLFLCILSVLWETVHGLLVKSKSTP